MILSRKAKEAIKIGLAMTITYGIALISYRIGQGFLQSILSFTNKVIGCNV